MPLRLPRHSLFAIFQSGLAVLACFVRLGNKSLGIAADSHTSTTSKTWLIESQ